jgi:hypothetical protein
MLVNLSAVDAQGRNTTKTFQGEAVTVAQQAVDMAALLTDFYAVSDLGTSKYNIIAETAAAQAVGNPAANKDEAAVLRLQLANGVIASHRIPAPAKDAQGVFLYITGGVVDINNALITDYVANFLAAGAFTIQGQVVTAVLSGYLED